MKRVLTILLSMVIVALTTYFLWPQKLSKEWDNSNNAIWVGTRWFTGFDKNEKRAMTSEEKKAFIEMLEQQKINQVYAHVGAINIDGTLSLQPSYFFKELQKETPHITYLPWIAGDAHKLNFANKEWRERCIQSIGRLYSMGFKGVHLNFEPVQNGDVGYLLLLEEIDEQFDSSFIISHATRRLVPSDQIHSLAKEQFWTKAYYQEVIHRTDETVLMGYDTMLPLTKLYKNYISFQTKTLLSLASQRKEHSIRIGIPSYEHGKKSNPKVENISTALMGIKAALYNNKNSPYFGGISIYSYWLTDKQEWKQYREGWLEL